MVILLILLLVSVPIISYICFRMAFYTSRKRQTPEMVLNHIYDPYLQQMEQSEKDAQSIPHKNVWVTSFDGLRLHGRYYEYAPDSPIELMMHGYRGNALRDLAGGIQRGFRLGHSVLLIDQRACGESQGHIITFGIREYKDCLSWVDFMVKEFGKHRNIILTGVSMGASTVLIAAGEKLPDNVVGVLADCGYTSAKEIIYSVIRGMLLPPKLAYPFVKLGAKLYGKFDLEETTPLEAMSHSTVPVIFFHGENDTFVPCYMSKANYKACTSRKRLVTIPKAGHGLSYLVDPEHYIEEMDAFFYKENALL